MKIKNEKGVTGIDIAGGIVVFAFASTIILSMYFNLYMNAVSIKIHQAVVAYITEIFERIDLENYDNITEESVLRIYSRNRN